MQRFRRRLGARRRPQPINSHAEFVSPLEMLPIDFLRSEFASAIKVSAPLESLYANWRQQFWCCVQAEVFPGEAVTRNNVKDL